MSKAKPPEKLNYEQAFEELEALVERLESGELALEESLALFERGQALSARCSELLEQAELKLRQLVPNDSEGYVETDFEVEE
jgi:exodeoxyribonuclease VII small subunit